MKAKDLIVELQKLDPETDIQVCACMFCGGSLSGDLYIDERRVTNWDHRLKQAVTTTVTAIEAE